MYITKIINQHRRDFDAEIKCEHCGATDTLKGGYDDSYYHNEVLPKLKCKKCGKAGGEISIKRNPKYDDSVTI